MNPYDELNIDEDAGDNAIQAAFRRKAQAAHPDKEGGSTESFQLVRTAYEILSDPDKRARYDATGKTEDETPVESRINMLMASCIDSADWGGDIADAMRLQVSRAVEAVELANAQHGRDVYEYRKRLGRVKGVSMDMFIHRKIDHIESVISANMVELALLENVAEELSGVTDSRVRPPDSPLDWSQPSGF